MNTQNSCSFSDTLETVSSKVRVLLIESDESCIDSVKKYLKKGFRKFEIDLATTLEEGIRKLEACAGHDDPLYDVIVLELALPNGGGISAFNAIDEQCKRLPIVVISKHEDPAAECVRRGAQDYIIRPDDLRILQKSLIYSIERFNVKKRYKQLVECTNAAIYEIDFVNNKLVYVNDTVSDLTGYSKEELLSINPFDLLSKESQEKFAMRLKRMSEGEFVPNSAEFQIMTKDGKKRWALVTADYMFKGESIIGARVVAIDVTRNRKKQKIIDGIYKSAPIGMGMLDYDKGKRTILRVNDRMCEMLNRKEIELVGNSARILYPNDEEFERVGKIKYEKIKSGDIGTIETNWVTKDGHILDILLSTSAVDPSEPEGCSSFTALDITEKRKLEKELDEILSDRINNWSDEIKIQSQMFYKNISSGEGGK